MPGFLKFVSNSFRNGQQDPAYPYFLCVADRFVRVVRFDNKAFFVISLHAIVHRPSIYSDDLLSQRWPLAREFCLLPVMDLTTFQSPDRAPAAIDDVQSHRALDCKYCFLAG